jgi:hypothetical protein
VVLETDLYCTRLCTLLALLYDHVETYMMIYMILGYRDIMTLVGVYTLYAYPSL